MQSLEEEIFEAMLPIVTGETIADVVEALEKIIVSLNKHEYHFDS